MHLPRGMCVIYIFCKSLCVYICMCVCMYVCMYSMSFLCQYGLIGTSFILWAIIISYHNLFYWSNYSHFIIWSAFALACVPFPLKYFFLFWYHKMCDSYNFFFFLLQPWGKLIICAKIIFSFPGSFY